MPREILTDDIDAAEPQRRKRGERHGELKPALLAAAAALLERHGPEGLSLRAVSRQAGVSQAAPYNHFASREHLLAELAAGGFADLAIRQAALAAGPCPPEKLLEDLAVDYVRSAQARPALYQLMFAGGHDWHAIPITAEAKMTSFHPVRQVLARMLDPSRQEAAATACWALVHGLSMLIIDGTLDGRDEATLRDAVRILVHGLPTSAPLG